VRNDVRTPTQTRMDARKVGEICGFAPVDCTSVRGLVLLVCRGTCCSGGGSWRKGTQELCCFFVSEAVLVFQLLVSP